MGGKKIHHYEWKLSLNLCFQQVNSHSTDNAMNVGAKWRLLLLLLLLLCFVLNSHSSSARWGCVWISSLCQCAKSGWSQTNCTGQFPYMFYIWLKLSHIYQTDRQVMTEALPGCLFLHLERDSFLLCFFVPPSFLYSGGVYISIFRRCCTAA